jgi:hypothetical protein
LVQTWHYNVLRIIFWTKASFFLRDVTLKLDDLGQFNLASQDPVGSYWRTAGKNALSCWLSGVYLGDTWLFFSIKVRFNLGPSAANYRWSAVEKLIDGQKMSEDHR